MFVTAPHRVSTWVLCATLLKTEAARQLGRARHQEEAFRSTLHEEVNIAMRKISILFLVLGCMSSFAPRSKASAISFIDPPPATVAVIDKDQFLNAGAAQTDFHLQIAGHFSANPSSDLLPNVVGGGGAPLIGNGTADFSGGTVPMNMSLTVSFKSDAATNTPQGYFTPRGTQANHVTVFSLAPNGIQVAFVPSGTDYLATFGLTNTDFSSLTGSLTVYADNGLDHFNLSQFDTLYNAQSILSLPNYSFGTNQGVGGITADISTDQYILIVGTADAGDGSGPHPFSLGLAPVPVPEPSSWLLLSTGLLSIGWRLRIPRRSSSGPRPKTTPLA
jgi:hypothetical protein